VTRPAATRSFPDQPNPLIALFRQCVVRVDDEAGMFLGTGFFVVPGLVLTCAHVVHGAALVQVRWQDRVASATTVLAEPPLESVSDPADYPLPDLAAVRLDSAKGWDHPCACLATGPPALGGSPDALYLAGYTIEHGPNPSLTGVTTEFESLISEDGHEFYKLKHGQVLHGFSGSPLLNMRSALVTGFVESTRGRHADLGGFAVAAAELASVFRELFESNQRYHADGADSRWEKAMEAEQTRSAEREGKRNRLPLRRAVVRLEPGADVSLATLLRPRHAVVDYIGREQLLSDLGDWCETERPEDGPELWFVTGAGGFGKTRLAVEACVEAEARGWTAGLLRPEVDESGLQQLAEWPGRLLIAVDYAETRPTIVGNLLEELATRAPRPPVRIMLLVRRQASRNQLIAMFNNQRVEEISELLRRAQLARLDSTETAINRSNLFDRAVYDFSTWLHTPCAGTNDPNLQAAHFARPLYVLVAALLATVSPAIAVDALAEQDLLREVLTEHEARYWERWDERQKLGLDPEDRRAAVALATLITATCDEEALTIARLIPHRGQEPSSRLIAIARWLAQLYPAVPGNGQISIGPLEPDRLGEVLVADVLRENPHLLSTVFDTASDRQLTRALTVVGRIAQIDSFVMDQLRTVLDTRMPDLLQRGLRARR
jgi:hypothetical protein